MRTVCLARNALPEDDMKIFLLAITGASGCSQLLTEAEGASTNFKFSHHIPGVKKTGGDLVGSQLEHVDLSNNSLQQLPLSKIITSNSQLVRLILACTSLGGVSSSLTFLGDRQTRLGIGDSFAIKNKCFQELCQYISGKLVKEAMSKGNIASLTNFPLIYWQSS